MGLLQINLVIAVIFSRIFLIPFYLIKCYFTILQFINIRAVLSSVIQHAMPQEFGRKNVIFLIGNRANAMIVVSIYYSRKISRWQSYHNKQTTYQLLPKTRKKNTPVLKIYCTKKACNFHLHRIAQQKERKTP